MSFLYTRSCLVHIILLCTRLEYTVAAKIRNRATGAFDVNSYAALGESFASGPSAGDPYENPNPCRRFTNNFGPQVNADPALLGSADDRTFDFIACSGSKLKQMYADNPNASKGKPKTSQAGQLANKNPDLVTLSIGGNDVGFVNLLDHCVYRFKDVFCRGCGFWGGDCSSDCAKTIEDVQANIDSDALSTGLDAAIHAVHLNAPNTHLYVTAYPQFFNSETTQCNNVQFNAGLMGLVVPCAGNTSSSYRRTILPLTQDRRAKMKTLTDNLNDKIKAAVDRARGGWNGRITFVDPNDNYDGHRFCDEGLTEPSYRNPDIWFYPFEFSQGQTMAYITYHDNSTSCEDILSDSGSGYAGDYYACEMAEGAAEGDGSASTPDPSWPASVDDPSTESLDGLPDYLARIFHPTINGNGAYKDAIISAYQDSG